MGITPILIAVSTGLSFIGSYQQAQSAKAQANYQAQVAENNAIIADQNRRQIELQGRELELEQRTKVRRALGTVRAATAGTGLLVDEVGTTPQALFDDMVVQGEMDLMKIRANVDRQEREAEIQGINFRADAGARRAEAESISPFLAGAVAGLGAFRSSGGFDLVPGT
jgi:hypothetical protein